MLNCKWLSWFISHMQYKAQLWLENTKVNKPSSYFSCERIMAIDETCLKPFYTSYDKYWKNTLHDTWKLSKRSLGYKTRKCIWKSIILLVLNASFCTNKFSLNLFLYKDRVRILKMNVSDVKVNIWNMLSSTKKRKVS